MDVEKRANEQSTFDTNIHIGWFFVKQMQLKYCLQNVCHSNEDSIYINLYHPHPRSPQYIT